MPMLFVRCEACGKYIDDYDVLTGAKYFDWNCPICNARNKATEPDEEDPAPIVSPA